MSTRKWEPFLPCLGIGTKKKRLTRQSRGTAQKRAAPHFYVRPQPMLILRGTIFNGVGHFRPRIENYPDVFEAATGEKLFPGTLNLRVARAVPPVEHFRVLGSPICAPRTLKCSTGGTARATRRFSVPGNSFSPVAASNTSG